jgi:hypothetical protein
MDRTVTFVCGKVLLVCKSSLECPASCSEFPDPFCFRLQSFRSISTFMKKGTGVHLENLSPIPGNRHHEN